MTKIEWDNLKPGDRIKSMGRMGLEKDTILTIVIREEEDQPRGWVVIIDPISPSYKKYNGAARHTYLEKYLYKMDIPVDPNTVYWEVKSYEDYELLSRSRPVLLHRSHLLEI